MRLPGFRRARWVRGALLLMVMLSLLPVELGRPTATFAREIDVVGTVDCGRRSGMRCSFDETLVLRTDQITGHLAPATIAIGWIKDALPALDQDDELTLTVEVQPDGSLRATGVAAAESRSGTLNLGLSSGNEKVGEARHDRGAQQDEDTPDNAVPTADVQPTPSPSPQVPGTVSGVVTSLQTGAAIPGATVTVGSSSAVTGSAGTYTVSGVAPGTYQAQATASGFVAQTQAVVVTSGTTSTASFALPTSYADLTITLTWGAQPPDLDLHLSGPDGSGGRFHAFFLNANPVAYASLTAQSRNGFGPEQVVIRRNPATGDYVAGDYHVWVHNFSRTPEFDISQARVVVNNSTQAFGAFDVGAASGDPTLDLWYVVNLQIDAAGNVTAVSQQRFTAGDSIVVLSPPYGTKPPEK
jgi:hypothetical protein